MEAKNEQISAVNEPSDQSGRQIPFDATTNFSLLGWLWDKFNKARRSKKLVDLNLEE
jgi:hypothetical protein